MVQIVTLHVLINCTKFWTLIGIFRKCMYLIFIFCYLSNNIFKLILIRLMHPQIKVFYNHYLIVSMLYIAIINAPHTVKDNLLAHRWNLMYLIYLMIIICFSCDLNFLHIYAKHKIKYQVLTTKQHVSLLDFSNPRPWFTNTDFPATFA